MSFSDEDLVELFTRSRLEELITEALYLWCIDQEIGSSEGLRQWVKQFLKENDD